MVDKKPSRVTLIGPAWPFRGGIARYTTRLAQTLQQKGHQVDFITPFRQYPAWLYPGKSERDPDSCPHLNFSRAIFSYFEPWTWRNVVQAVHASSSERVLVPFWSKVHLPFLNYLYRSLQIPTLTILHNLFDHDSGPFTRFVTRRILKHSDYFLCHSTELLHDPLFRNSLHKIRCQPLPIISEPTPISKELARSYFKIPAHQKVFLFFGLIRPYKGFSFLLEACQRLAPTTRFTLLVAGEPWGKLRRKVEDQINQSKHLFPIISHLEWLPEREVPFWFSACDVLVAPYLEATGSSVIAQAVTYNKPIVTTPVGGIPEQLHHYPRAFFSKPGDSESLAHKMVDSIKETELKESVESVSDESDWNVYIDNLI